MRRPSIAWRLAIGLSIMVAVLWLGAATIAGFVMQRELDSAFDELLEQAAYRLLPLAMHQIREPGEEDELRIGGVAEDEGYFAYYVVRPNGSVIIRADDVPDTIIGKTIPNGYGNSDGRRVFALTDTFAGYRVIVLERTEHRAAALAQSLGGLFWPLLALIPLSAIGIWFSIRLAMRPVEAMSRDIASRDRSNLTPLSLEGQPVELAPIAEAVADLLERLRSALAAERAFAASSAHELRTPIAGALAQVQQLAIELGGQPPQAHRLREVETALRHLSQLSEKLLQLSRLEAGFARSDVGVDLAPILQLVVRDFQSSALYRDRIRFEDSGGGLSGRIDVDAFAIALRNLIENALVHGETGGTVKITAEPGNRIRVSNGGPQVPGSLLENIAEPFTRGATSAKGTGLGLSIVRTIMEQTGGTLTLHSPATGQADGFEAVLTLGRWRCGDGPGDAA